jgi:hypothetical protein
VAKLRQQLADLQTQIILEEKLSTELDNCSTTVQGQMGKLQRIYGGPQALDENQVGVPPSQRHCYSPPPS